MLHSRFPYGGCLVASPSSRSPTHDPFHPRALWKKNLPAELSVWSRWPAESVVSLWGPTTEQRESQEWLTCLFRHIAVCRPDVDLRCRCLCLSVFSWPGFPRLWPRNSPVRTSLWPEHLQEVKAPVSIAAFLNKIQQSTVTICWCDAH